MALKIFGEFEIEHLMAQALFGNPEIGAFLNGMGITKDMRGNKIALYANADHVAQILDGPEELREALRTAGHGPVRHEGGDNHEGGKQAGKNDFLIERVDLIRTLAELPPDNPSHLSPQAAKLAVFNLFAWITDVAQGKVTHNGQILGVMGGAAFADTLDAASVGWVVPRPSRGFTHRHRPSNLAKRPLGHVA